jgi:hypothetical protein
MSSWQEWDSFELALFGVRDGLYSVSYEIPPFSCQSTTSRHLPESVSIRP